MLSMADWYLKASQECDNEHSGLSRILDVAQDLKALLMMFNGQPFPFVIDLAILASRWEDLNLDKWLADNIREHGEIFVAATVKFLQWKIPTVTGPGRKEKAVPKGRLPVECLATIILCLQVWESSWHLSCSMNIVHVAPAPCSASDPPAPAGRREADVADVAVACSASASTSSSPWP
jgi:CCR4-NOT transcription complex subunit 1